MTDPRAPRITNTDAARLLSGAGEQLVATLEAVREGHPLEHPAQRTMAQVDDIIERARQSMSREAARLLYMGAQSALERDPDHRVLSPVDDPANVVPWPQLARRAEQLARRGRALGESQTTWPRTSLGQSASAGRALAAACVALATDIRPGWEWLQLMRGILLLEQDSWDDACHELRASAELGFDWEVRRGGLRNLCRGLASTDRADELAARIQQLRSLSSDDRAHCAYFQLELGRIRHDREGVERACAILREGLASEEVRMLSATLRLRARIIDEGVGTHCVEALIEELL